MDVDSDSDMSLPDQDYAAGKKKGKGTGKAGERERGKRKGKAKENVRRVCFFAQQVLHSKRRLATVYMGSIIFTVLGYGPRGRGG